MEDDRLMACIASTIEVGLLVVDSNRVVYYNDYIDTLFKKMSISSTVLDSGAFFSSSIYFSKKKIYQWQRAMLLNDLWTDLFLFQVNGKSFALDLRVRSVNRVVGKKGEYVIIIKEIQQEDDAIMSAYCLHEKSDYRSKDVQKEDTLGDLMQLSYTSQLTDSVNFYAVGINLPGKIKFKENEFGAIRESYNLLVDYLDFPLFVINEEMKVSFANYAALQFFKYPINKRSHDYDDIINLFCNPKFLELKEHFASNGSDIKPQIGISTSGEMYERHCVPLFKDGVVVSLMVMLRIIKGYEREVMLLNIDGNLPKSIVETIKAGMVRLNQLLEISYANEELHAILKYEPFELVGIYIGDLIVLEYREILISRLYQILVEDVSFFREDLQVYSGTGEKVWVETLIARDKEDHLDFSSITLTFNDISHRKIQESELMQQLSQVKGMKDKMDKFYSIIGHDVKTPILTTRMIASGLLQHVEMQNDAVSIKHLKYISQLAEEGLELLDNLIAWTKSVVTGIDFEPTSFRLKILFEEIMKYFSITAKIKNVEFVNNICDNIELYGDRNMLKTVFRNVISNALKFSNRGGVVSFSIEQDSKKSVVVISDNGVGFDGEVLKDFDFKTENIGVGTANEVGSGIGLKICQNFIQRHGGRLSIFSKKNRGTVVRIELGMEQ